ncbi:uncharacterized protein LOC120125357 [Hibiscus syriacus]|uniref:uncharacterized protein LOC120125357 n=1 Tax=Hibiscus syriacus TaxID=106335 RepID=UPI0019241C10|nr:uncharacterized protein LOC120125357 [Hibiscus syriacus]
MSSEVKVSAARKLFRCQRVEVAYIQETEKEMFSEDDVRKVWYDDDFDFRKEGLSCGLVTIWDKSKFQVERCFIGKNEVDAGVVNQESRISIFFIENCKLFDVPLIGRKFTWYGSNGRRSRLDRVFVEEDWMVSNPDTTLWGLSRSASDHLPRPFKFINVWLKQEGCVETIKEAMEAANKTDNEFHSKLKIIKGALRRWNKESCSDFDSKAQILERRINEIEELEDKGKSGREFARRIVTKAVKIRSKRRTILGPNLGEGSGADPKKLKQKVFNHFQEQFSCNKRGWQAIFNLDFKRLSTMAASNLELPLSLEEIRDDVWSCDDSKAPGPDGFNMLFFKKCWEMANDDLVKVFEKFYRNGNLEKNVNSSILALIPKTSSPKEGRQIFDGILIANEVLHSMQQESNEMGGQRMGFRIKWRAWIWECILTVKVSVLLNSSPTKEFKMMKGLRQGDPLSPFLFIMVTEALHLVLEKAIEKGSYKALGCINHIGLKGKAVRIMWSERDPSTTEIGIANLFVKNLAGHLVGGNLQPIWEYSLLQDR